MTDDPIDPTPAELPPKKDGKEPVKVEIQTAWGNFSVWGRRDIVEAGFAEDDGRAWITMPLEEQPGYNLQIRQRDIQAIIYPQKEEK